MEEEKTHGTWVKVGTWSKPLKTDRKRRDMVNPQHLRIERPTLIYWRIRTQRTRLGPEVTYVWCLLLPKKLTTESAKV